MSFDAGWFGELRAISDAKLRVTRERGIEGFVPQVGELCRDGYVSVGFVEEAERLVRLLDETPCRFGAPFRAYERHVVTFPKGRAFRKQWNVGFTAGETPEEDHVRIGIGFRLTEARHDDYQNGIYEYLEFREQARRRPAAFDALFEGLGGYWEIDGTCPPCGAAVNSSRRPSDIVIADNPEPDCWRFFGRRLMVRDAQDRTVIRSHELLRDVAVDVFGRIQRGCFGM